MSRKPFVIAVVLALAALFIAVARAAGPEVLVAGDAHGLSMARGEAQSHLGGKPSLNLINHGGPVMTSGAAVRAIFWGRAWNSPTFAGDKVTGLDTFYGGISGSNYLGTNTEYTNSSGAHVSSSVSYGGQLFDGSAAPSKDPGTTAVLAEVDKALTAASVTPARNGYYPVYTDIPRGRATYCAWHSWGTTHNGTLVQFAFFFSLDGDAGCDPNDASTGHSQGLAALANVSGHELSEALTDPNGNAWYDRQGAENADKCAWTFSGTQHFGGSTWKIQGNWGNAAGGCLYGT